MRTLLFGMLVFGSVLSAGAQERNSFCPKVSAAGPAGMVIPGDEIPFTAEISDRPFIGVRYEWSVEGAVIVAGQGTNRIRVSAAPRGSTVKATLRIFDTGTGCEYSASSVVEIPERIACGLPYDSWNLLKPNDVRLRLDAFFADLVNNPDSTGLLILEAAGSERRDRDNKRIRFIVNHAKYRKFDLSRIVFVFEKDQFDEETTILHRLSPKAEFPCPECVRINGSDLN